MDPDSTWGSEDHPHSASVSESPVPLTVTALEQWNESLPSPSDTTLSRWLHTLLSQHPSSDFDSLPPVTPRKDTLSTPSNNEPHSLVPSEGSEIIQIPPKAQEKVQSLSANDLDVVAITKAPSPTKWIILAHRSCERSLRRLSELLDQNEIPQTLRDDIGRFRVWTANSGAHRRDRVSLDHRLRESPNMKKMVIDLLEDLNYALQNGEPQPSVRT
jgi:hypothetical protein